jgi:SecD/SecF fusion protein
MTTDDPVVSALSRTNPEPAPVPGPDAEALLARILAEAEAEPEAEPEPAPATIRTRRHPARVLVPLASVVVVLALVAVLLVAGSHPAHRAPGVGGERIVYRALPTPLVPQVTPTTLRHEVAVLQAHARSAGLPVKRVALAGHDEIAVTLTPGSDVAAVERLVTSVPRLYVYDWEANVITPGGRTVVSGLRAHRNTAIALSQGRDGGPGTARAGGMPLYAAVRLAARRRPAPDGASLSRLGPQYYLFQDGGSATCPGPTPCYLGGPVVHRSDLPGGGTRIGTRTLVVPQGTLVIQAAAQSAPAGAPRARFYVLRDRIAVNGGQIDDPTVGPAANGGDQVSVRMTASAQRQFRRVTATLAHRGERLSTGATLLDQHLAIVFDGRLLSLPQIAFTEFPDGVQLPGPSIEISGEFTPRNARTLAAELQLAVAPLALQRISPKG